MLRRIEATAQIIHQPVFIRLAGRLPLEHAFAGQAATELHDDLRLRQFADRFTVAQPQVGARQRLPGLRQDIANQRPAEGLRPFSHFFTFCGAHPTRDHYAAFLPPEEPVALFLTLHLQRLTQPGLIALPPVAELLLPPQPGIVHIAI